MVEDLVVIHRKSHQEAQGEPRGHAQGFDDLDDQFWIKWQTCLRQVAVSIHGIVPPSLLNGDEIYQGRGAYTFLLEVVCGLHSPVLGETEVMGQFKELVEKFAEVSGAAGGQAPLFRLLLNLLTDAKRVRESCLRELGSQSYGSLLRRHVKGASGLHILGAGKLAREVLPWLYNKVPAVHLHCRRPDKVEDLKKEFPKIHIHQIAPSINGDGVLLIAAPVSASMVKDWFGRGAFTQIIDLREESQSDPCQSPVPILKLQDFFNQIRVNHSEIQTKIKAAKSLIAELALVRFKNAEIRPFGWEDLCG